MNVECALTPYHTFSSGESAAPPWLHASARAAASGRIRDTFIRRALGRKLTVTDLPPPRLPQAAAVLVLLAGDHSPVDEPHMPPVNARILLTHRCPHLRHHSGQVAFPGGRQETGETLVDCALRETWEETGIPAAAVTPLAGIGRVAVRRTGMPVYPILGYQQRPHAARPASINETDEVWWASVMELCDPANRLTVRVNGWKGPAFRSNGYLVWGFTAGVLNALLTCSGWERPWDEEAIVELAVALEQSRNEERVAR